MISYRKSEQLWTMDFKLSPPQSVAKDSRLEDISRLGRVVLRVKDPKTAFNVRVSAEYNNEKPCPLSV